MLSNVLPDAADQYRGPLQVIPLKACVTGSATEAFLPYRNLHTKEWKGKDHHQFDTRCHCRMQLMKQHLLYMAHAKRRTIQLFDIASSQKSSNNNNLHPPQEAFPQEAFGGVSGGKSKIPILRWLWRKRRRRTMMTMKMRMTEEEVSMGTSGGSTT
jgi:hypothetical protein